MPEVVIVVVQTDEGALKARLARLEDEERWLISVLETHDKVIRSLFREQGPIIATNHQRHVVNFTEEMRKRLQSVKEEIKRVSAFAQARDSEQNNPTSSLAQFVNSHKEA